MKNKICVLDDKKICDNCKQCDICDLNPEKICDNCGKCIETHGNFAKIKIDDIEI